MPRTSIGTSAAIFRTGGEFFGEQDDVSFVILVNMLRLPTIAALASTFIFTGVVSEVAEAGPLAKTARGVDHKSSGSDRDRDTSNSDDNDNTRDHRNSDDRDSGFGMTTATSTQATCYTCDDDGQEFQLGPPAGSIGFAGQKVRDSDGSFRLGANVLFGEVGAHLSVDHYFENISAKGTDGLMEEDVRMNLVDVGPMVRLFADDALNIDLRLGLSFAASSHFETLPGGMVGIRAQAIATNKISLNLEGRAMRYQDDISAYEGAVGAQYDIVWLGYRSLKFDVGPALHGPEAGLKLNF